MTRPTSARSLFSRAASHRTDDGPVDVTIVTADAAAGSTEVAEAFRDVLQFVVSTGVSLDVTEPPSADDVAVARAASAVPVWCRPVRAGAEVLGAIIATPVEFRRPTEHERAWLHDLALEASAEMGGGAASTPADLVDPLTGAATPRRLQEGIDARLDGTAVLYLDLDGLDEVNENYGRAAGDAVLVEVARRLDGIVRSADLVVRTVSDEFAIVIRDAAELASIRIAARVIDELGMPYEVQAEGDESVLVAVSAGVGLCVQCPGTEFDVALEAAYAALREAKAAGPDHLHVVSR